MNYQFSKNTFPANKKVKQHAADIKDDDTHFECTLLAGNLLGVECCDTVMKGDRELDFDITYFQITPDPYQAKTEEERRDFQAFNNYFYANYGKHKDRCYFDTEHEAFYNIVKAWKIWKHILADEEKQKYFENWQLTSCDREPRTANKSIANSGAGRWSNRLRLAIWLWFRLDVIYLAFCY